MKRIKTLAKKGYIYHFKLEGVCVEILEELKKIVYCPEDAWVSIVPGDGYCLCFDGIGSEVTYNLPIGNVIDKYKEIKRKLTFEELRRL